MDAPIALQPCCLHQSQKVLNTNIQISSIGTQIDHMKALDRLAALGIVTAAKLTSTQDNSIALMRSSCIIVSSRRHLQQQLQLTVFGSGADVIVCIARDSSQAKAC